MRIVVFSALHVHSPREANLAVVLLTKKCGCSAITYLQACAKD